MYRNIFLQNIDPRVQAADTDLDSRGQGEENNVMIGFRNKEEEEMLGYTRTRGTRDRDAEEEVE